MADIRAGQPFQPIGQYKPLHILAFTAATPVPIGLAVNTTIALAITAGNGVVVTPASMANITKGKRLSVVNGSTQEAFTVLAVTGTTFTANFVNSYAINSNLYSLDGAWLGPVVVNKAGATDVLTLYNGLPGMLPVAGAAIAVASPMAAAGATYGHQAICEKGLFYTYTGTTAGDLTLYFLDHPPSSAI